MDSIYLLQIIFLSCYVPVYLYYTVLFVKRRALWPIAQRQPSLVLALGIVLPVLLALHSPAFVPCFAWHTVHTPLLTLAVLLVAARAWVLLFSLHCESDLIASSMFPSAPRTAG